MVGNMPDESVIAAENRGLREEIVKAQSNSTAWMGVFETIEAHLRDRIAMNDPGDPASYLSIIQNATQDVQRDGRAIAKARWADSARYEAALTRLTARASTTDAHPLEGLLEAASEPYPDAALVSIAISLKRIADALQGDK